MHLRTTIIALLLLLAPASTLACGEDQAALHAMGYTRMTAQGRPLYLQRMSRRQLKAFAKVVRDNQLFGYTASLRSE